MYKKIVLTVVAAVILAAGLLIFMRMRAMEPVKQESAAGYLVEGPASSEEGKAPQTLGT